MKEYDDEEARRVMLNRWGKIKVVLFKVMRVVFILYLLQYLHWLITVYFLIAPDRLREKG